MRARQVGGLVAVILGILGCTGSKHVLSIHDFPSQFVFTSRNADGTLTKMMLTRGEPLAALIEKWCKDNPSGWSKSHDSFAPSFQFSTADALLNVRSDFVVANVKQVDGRWVQLIKPTPPRLWEEINRLVALKALKNGQPSGK